MVSEFKGAVRVQPIQVVRVLWADDERIAEEIGRFQEVQRRHAERYPVVEKP